MGNGEGIHNGCLGVLLLVKSGRVARGLVDLGSRSRHPVVSRGCVCGFRVPAELVLSQVRSVSSIVCVPDLTGPLGGPGHAWMASSTLGLGCGRRGRYFVSVVRPSRGDGGRGATSPQPRFLRDALSWRSPDSRPLKTDRVPRVLRVVELGSARTSLQPRGERHEHPREAYQNPAGNACPG